MFKCLTTYTCLLYYAFKTVYLVFKYPNYFKYFNNYPLIRFFLNCLSY